MPEEWRPVLGLEEFEVSDRGRVRKLLTLKIDRLGYMIAHLVLGSAQGSKWRPVHQLVAEAFLGSRPSGLEVNHKDGNKANNQVSNLEWATPSENAEHAFRTGLRHGQPGERNPMSKLTARDITEIRRQRGFVTQRELARHYGVQQGTIHRIQVRKRWQHI